MNSRRRVAFLLAIAMILVSLPFSGGITTYASALSEEDGTIIINESTGEMLVTDDDLKDGQMAESEEDIADINDDFLIISDEDTTPLLEADDGCEDGKLFESNEDIEGVNEEIPSDKLWGDAEACYVSVVGQKFPFYYYGQPNISEGLGNLEMTRIPGSAFSYFKGKKAGLTTFTWYIEDTTQILGLRFLDISEVHPQSCEVEHASSPMGFDDIVEFYFCGRFRGIYYELENPEHYLYSLSPILFKIKDLSTQEVFYIGENYEDTNYALNNSFVPNVSNYEVSAIFPNIMYDPDRDEPFYQVKGPEGSAMKLKIDSVGGGKQRLVPIPVKSITLKPKTIKLKPDYNIEMKADSIATISVEISPNNASVESLIWEIDGAEAALVEGGHLSDCVETNPYLKDGKLFSSVRVSAWDKEGIAKIKVSTEDGSVQDEAVVYIGVNPNQYCNVTFMSDGESYTVQQVLKGNKVGIPKAPSKENCSFAGWYTDENFTKEYDFAKEVKSNFILYARWTRNRIINGLDATIVAQQKISLPETCFSNVKEKITRYIVEDNKVASVSDKMLSGKSAGTVKIEAQVKNGKVYETAATCNVTVLSKPVLKFPNTLTYDGQTITASNYFTTADTNIIGATYWESSNPAVAEVINSGTGVIQAHKSGTAHISAYFGEKGKQGILKVSASLKVKIPAFQKSEYNMQTGADMVIAMKDTDKTQNPIWTVERMGYSDYPPITASPQYDSRGNATGKVIVKGMFCGDARLIATIDGHKYSCVIHVAAPQLSKYNMTIRKGGTATISLKNTKLKKSQIQWSSADVSIATVDADGRIKGISPGETLVYTTAGGCWNQCTVTVK